MSKKTKAKRSLYYSLKQRGFDQSRFDRSSSHYVVKCSQCRASVINGVACHETGCPNHKRNHGRQAD